MAPSQGNTNSPLAASPRAITAPKGTANVSVDVREGENSKAKSAARKTPSPGKSALSSPLQPPATKYARKTPSPAKPQQSPLKVDIDLAGRGAAGRKTPSPASRKTPSPNTRSTSSPGVRKTSSPSVGRKTPSPNVSRKTPSPNVNRKTPSPNVNRKTPSPSVNRKTASPSLVQLPVGSQRETRKTPSPKVVSPKPGPSTSQNPLAGIPNLPSVSPKGTTGSAKKGASNPKPSTSKDGKSIKRAIKDKTAMKNKKKNKLKLLSPKKSKDGSVTKKIKKSLQLNKKKLKVVLGQVKAKSAKLAKVHQTGRVKKPPSPPEVPAQAAAAPAQTPRAAALTSPKKLTPSPSGGKPRPRIDDIARRLSIENREKRDEKKTPTGKESPALKDGNGKKEKGNERRNSRDKDEKSRGMNIKMVPVICPWAWKGAPETKQVAHTVSVHRDRDHAFDVRC